jgi:hypothetical protein
MPSSNWEVDGEYFESCNCDFACPCTLTGMTAAPTHGFCNVQLTFHINQGHFNGTRLDGLNFVTIIHSDDAIIKGNLQVGLIVDQRASKDQQQAIAGIASGQAGGPMAALAPLVGKMLGVEVRPIQFTMSGMHRSVSVPGALEQAIEGVPGANPAEPQAVDNLAHPVNTRLAFARASDSHLHVFGIDWDDTSGKNNGHFAPFNWRSS